ncbi:Adrenodoxin [Carpediemonas membranifera]|uniref:Adrenodoxin n=1 Tax=Carpediemonas membranifera TaxID=201153 RepID=A0A8J6AWC5_9EUKA|nr:Adrenodoxin [Carpediemonas membranifera]|eukprot:KAG9394145.1 Adrenodoxin [Carpediemonas membranifera]
MLSTFFSSHLNITNVLSSAVAISSFPRFASTVPVTFQKGDQVWKDVPVDLGSNLMREAQRNGINLGGACEGSCACSTCHVYVDQEHFDKLPEASEREDDMIDFAFEPDVTSRLACQIEVTPELSGARVDIPLQTRNMVSEEDLLDL